MAPGTLSATRLRMTPLAILPRDVLRGIEQRMRCSRLNKLFFPALVVLAISPAALASGPIVAGFERFGRPTTDPAAQIESGLLLIGELGCVNCHAPTATAAAHLLPKRGPILDRVGQRLAPQWLMSYLKDPQGVKPGTTMPHLLASLPEADRGRTATALAHYLASTGSFDNGPFQGSEKANAGEGQRVYERAGCAVCHGSRVNSALLLPDQAQLIDIDTKWSPQALDDFLKDPLAVRPSSRMPALPLKDDERRQLTASLLGKPQTPQHSYRDTVAFSGRAWLREVDKLPAIESLGAATKAAAVKGFDVVALAGSQDGFVVQLQGFLHATRAGVYQFYLLSDDGSRLFIDNTLVVDHDGIHSDSERYGSIQLTAGIHPIRIDYFEASGREVLALDIKPPRGPRVSALAFVTPAADGTPAFRPEDAGDEAESFTLDSTLVEAGRAAFATVGCAHCHQLAAGDGKPVAPQEGGKSLTDLDSLDTGCLAAGGGGRGPRYGLDDAQRTAVATAIAWLQSPEAIAPPDHDRAIDRTLTALNCYACHSRLTPGRDGKGGVLPALAAVDDDGEPILREAARDALFTSAVLELGDEGRLPPTLTGTGDKLRPEFLREVLLQGGKDRGLYMHTLMPKWHASVAEPLARLLADDPKTQQPVPTLTGHNEAEIDDAGRHLVGSKALGCIKCHSFGGEKGQSTGVVDLARTPQRLRHEWFLAYVANPQQFRPGTRMPAGWPEGKTFYPDTLDGTAAGQIEGVWRYLAGAKPRPPIGVGSNPIELVPIDRPIIYRNFIAGAGPRAIGVGYPEKVNLAWDAEQLRLALVWRGAFIDAGRHWTGRGEGWQPPLGDAVFTPDAAAAIAVLESSVSPWPSDPRKRGARFGGYALDATGRPTFTWSLDGMRIRETIQPATGGDRPILRRTIRLEGRPQRGEVFFRAAVAANLEATGDGWQRVDGRWRVRVSGSSTGPAEATRTADGKIQLRHPIVWTAAQPRERATAEIAEIIEELSW